MKKKSMLVYAIFVVMLIPALVQPGAATVAQPNREDAVYGTGYWHQAWHMRPLDSNPAYGIAYMYEPLFGWNEITQEVVPVLGTEFSWKSGGTGVTIELNPDAKWSDGSAVDADDVVATYKFATNTSAYKGDMTDRIDAITKIDADTVEIDLKAGYEYSSLLKVWITGMIPILPEHVWTPINASNAGNLDNFSNFWFGSDVAENQKVLSGPYEPYYRDADGTVEIYQYREDWWGANKIHLDVPGYSGVPEAKFIGKREYGSNLGQDTALLTDQVDYHSGYYHQITNGLLQNENVNTIYGRSTDNFYMPTGSVISMAFNHNNFPFNKLEFRKAIAYGINYDDLIYNTASGYLKRARQGFLDNRSLAQVDLYDHAIQEAYGIDYNFTTAVGYLEEIAYAKDGAWYSYDATGEPGVNATTDDDDSEVAGVNVKFGDWRIDVPQGWSDVIQAVVYWTGYFGALNITTIKDEIAYGVWTENVGNGNFDIILNTVGPALVNNPFQFLQGYRGTHQFNANVTYWENSTFNDLFEQLETTENDEAAQKLIASQMQEILAKEIPEIPTTNNGFWYAFNDKYWEGWITEDNLYNQPTTVFTVHNMAMKQRLMLGLSATGATERRIPWTGFSLSLSLALFASVVIVKMRSKKE